MAQDSGNVKKPAGIVGNKISSVNMLLESPENPEHPVAAPVDLHLCQSVEEYRKLLPEDQIIQSYGTIADQAFDDLMRIHDDFDYDPSIGVLDSYYMKSSFLAEFVEESSLAIVTKARIDTVAYKEPETKKPGTRGPQAKVGEKIKLQQCFTDQSLNWQETSIELYGKERRVRFLVLDLLWNRTQRLKLRFVLVEILDKEGLRKSRMILACTDRKIFPEDIVIAYCYRMKIELSFRDMNQQIGLSSYHFWTKEMPELELGETSSEEELDSDQKELIAKNLKRVETHLSISMVALGLTQTIALKLAEAGITEDQLNWKRTYSNKSVSAGSVKRYLQEKLLSSRSSGEKAERATRSCLIAQNC